MGGEILCTSCLLDYIVIVLLGLVLAPSSRNAIPHPIPSPLVQHAQCDVIAGQGTFVCVCFSIGFRLPGPGGRHILKSRPRQSPSTPLCSGPDDPPIYEASLVVHPSAFSPPWPLSSAQLHTGPVPRVEHRAETYRTVQPASRMPGVRGCRPNWTTVYQSPLPFPSLLSLLSSPTPSLLSSPKIFFSSPLSFPPGPGNRYILCPTILSFSLP